MSEWFSVLNEALDEAVEDAREHKAERKQNTISLEIPPLHTYTATDIQAIRRETGLTQGMLAKWLGVSVRTVEAWEIGKNHPSGPSSRLLSLLQTRQISLESG